MNTAGTQGPSWAISASKSLLATLSFLAISVASICQTITTATPTNSFFCNGSSVTVTASSWSGLSSGSNSVQVQLSDASGSFASPTLLTTGTLSGASGSNANFNVTIPDVSAGSGYRVRVIRVSPSSTANASSAFSIAEAYNATFLVNETVGTGTSGNPGTYSGYTHNGTYTYSGSGSSIVTSNASPGSGSSSVLLDNNSETWQIAGINSSSANLVQLTFRVRKSSNSESGSNLSVEFSTNGSSYSTINWGSLPTGSGTSGWYQRTATTLLPAASNLRVRFTRTGGSSSWQIDDVQVVSGVASAVSISPSTSQTICATSPINISATTLSNAEYLWSTNATTSSISVNSTGSYDVVVSDYFGCTPYRGPVSVSASPASVGGTTSGSATVCPNSNSGSITLSGHTGSVTRWQSSTNNGISWTDISNTSTTLAYSNLTTTTQYRAVVTSGTCSSANSSVTTISMAPIPVPSLTISTANTTVCAGNLTTFSASPVNGGSTPSFQWKKNGSNVGTNSSSYSDYQLVSGDIISCVLTSNEACASPTTATSNSISMTVNPYGQASVSIATSGNNLCAGSSVTFTATPVNGGTSPSYQWKVNGSNVGTNSDTYTTTSLSNGNVVSVEMTSNYACLIPNAEIDPNFPATQPNDLLYTTKVQSDGKILVGGEFSQIGSSSRSRIARYNSNGTHDTSFNPGSGIAGPGADWVSDIEVQADGKIIIVGNFNSYNGNTFNNIVRVNSNGSIDSSFDPGSGANNDIYTVKLQNDGKILIVGPFSSYDGTTARGIARLNTDGSIDTSYSPDMNNGGVGWDIAIQQDGKAIVVGDFTSIDGTGRNRIARINTNGSLDTSFNPGSGANDVINSIDIQNDGDILIGGDFTSYNGTSRTRVARINPNGTVETAFVVTGGANNNVYDVLAHPTNSPYFSGSFTTLGGNNAEGLARTSAAGAYDTNFPTAALNMTTAWNLETTSSNELLVSGSFNNAGSTSLDYLVKIRSNVATSPEITMVISPTSVGGTANGSATVCAGANGTITLSGRTGSILKWQSSTNNGTSWSDIANTSATLNYSNITTTTQFRAVVQSGVCPEVNSSVATITVDAPSVGGTVNTSTTVCSGLNSGTVNLSGQTGNVLNWQRSTDNGASWSNITNTSTSQSFNNLTQATQYRAVVRNGVCPSTNSVPAIISLNQQSVGGSTSGAATVCATSNSGTLNLSGITGSVTKWQSSTNAGTTWDDIANSSTSYSYSNLTQTTSFRAVVTSGVCPSANSSVTTINVSNPTVAGAVISDATVCASSNSGSVSISGNTGSVIAWQFSTTGGSTWTNLLGAGNTRNYSNLSQTTLYRAQVQSGVCASQWSAPATITVNPTTDGGSTSGSTTVCEDGNSGNIVLSGFVGTITKWQSSTNGGSTWSDIAETASTLAYNNVTQPTQYRAVVQSGVCASANSTVATISTSTATVAGAVSSSTAVCSGSNSGTLNLTGFNGSILGWQISTNNGITWSNLVGTSSARNFSNLTQTTIYRAQVQSGVCSAIWSTPATVTVNEIPTGIISGNASICPGESTDLTLEFTGVGPWSGVLSNGLNFTSSNPTYQISVSPSANSSYSISNLNDANCAALASVSATSATISIRNVNAVISGNNTICQGETAEINFAFTGSGPFTYTYTDGTSSFGPFTSSIANANVNVSPASTTSYNLIAANDNFCSASISGTSNVIVNTNPSVFISGENSFCAIGSNSSADLLANITAGSGTIASIQWSINNSPLSSANGTTYEASATGNYRVNVEDSNGCVSESNPWAVALEVFNITTSTIGNGTITAASNATCGSTRSITINADPCHYIGSVVLNGSPVNIGSGQLGTYVLNIENINEDITVEASFNIIQFNITTQANTDAFLTASISNFGTITRDCGSSETFTIVPGPCTRLQDVIVNGNSIGAMSTFTLNSISSNYAIYVILERIQYEIVANAGVGGSISPSGTNSYFCGTNPVFNVTPNSGFAIVGVTIDGNPVGALSTISLNNLSSSATIQATFAPVPNNNSYAIPSSVISPNFPSCVTNGYTLEGCTPSPESDDDDGIHAPVGSGQDAWFRFRVPVGGTGIMRIQANSTSNNIAIILRRENVSGPAGVIAVENSVNTIGNEIMNVQGLIPGAYYRVAVKNVGLQNAGPFTICMSSLRNPGCGTVTTPTNGASLCDLYSVAYSGANSYTITVTNQDNPSEVYVRTNNGGITPASTIFTLSSMPGLRYNSSYTVQVDAVHLLSNGAGTTQAVSISGAPFTCTLYTRPQPSSTLVAADQCSNGPKMKNQVISVDWVCGAIDFEWQLTPTTGLPFPYTTFRGVGDRFMRVGSLNGINSGATTFNVRVRPIFNDGLGGRRNGEWSPTTQLCIVGAAALGEVAQDEPAAHLSTRMLSSEETNAPVVGVYPNPTNGDFFNLAFDNVTDEKVNVRMIDFTGKVVMNKQFSLDGASVLRVELGNSFASGIYTVEVNANGESFTQRLIVQN